MKIPIETIQAKFNSETSFDVGLYPAQLQRRAAELREGLVMRQIPPLVPWELELRGQPESPFHD
jgi:hypothetical protein